MPPDVLPVTVSQSMEGFYLLSWDGNGNPAGYSAVRVVEARLDREPWMFLVDRGDWKAWVEDWRLRRARRFQTPFPMSSEEFGREVEAAIDGIPSWVPFGQVGFSVTEEAEESPLGELCSHEESVFSSTFGRYAWWPLEAFVPPVAKIELYRMPILRNSASLEGARARIRTTVVHEVAHHVGFGEARVRELEREAQREVWRLNRAAVLGLDKGQAIR